LYIFPVNFSFQLQERLHIGSDISEYAISNDFGEILSKSKIKRVFCTGKTAFSLWNKTCAEKYEERYHLTVECLPSTSPANAACTLEKLIEAFKVIYKF